MPLDPYRDWLGISTASRPLTLYQLLGLAPFESDPKRIERAAAERMAAVRKHATGSHAASAQAMLKQLTEARAQLLDPARKQRYDSELAARARSAGTSSKPAAPATPATAAHASSDASGEAWAPDPVLTSALRRGPGLGHKLAGWLVGIGLLVVVGTGGAFVALRVGRAPIATPGNSNHATTPADAADRQAPSSADRAAAVPAETPGSGETTKAAASPRDAVTTSPPAVSDKPAPVTPRAPAQVLRGALVSNRSLSSAASPFYLEGSVLVRPGVSLRLEAGSEIVADPDSALVVKGQLVTDGSPESPVRLRGERPGAGGWGGVRLEGEDCELHLRGTVISDAETALTLAGTPSLEKTNFDIESSLFTGNGTGIRIESFVSPRVRNSAVVRNRADGVSAREDDGVYTQLTLAGNGGRGYVCSEKPAFQLDACAIVGNAQGGIQTSTANGSFGAKWSAMQSNIFSNSPFDVFCAQPGGVILSGDYWGATTTRELKALGDNPKKRPRRKIWDGLHPKYRASGIVIPSSPATDYIESAGTDAAVLAMAGDTPLDLAHWDAAKRQGRTAAEEAGEVPEVPPLFADLAAQLRELLPTRHYIEAAELLEEALGDPDLRDVADLIRAAQQDVRLIQELWRLAAERVSERAPGDVASVGGIRGEFVRYENRVLTIRSNNIERTSAFTELRPTDIILLVTRGAEPNDPELAQKIWLFLRADRQGLGRDVDHWAQLAAQAGADLRGRGIYLILKGTAKLDE